MKSGFGVLKANKSNFYISIFLRVCLTFSVSFKTVSAVCTLNGEPDCDLEFLKNLGLGGGLVQQV